MDILSAFFSCDIRVGKIIEVLDFPEARKPAYKLRIDLGPELGIKKSTAQIIALYTKEELIGIHIICLVNIPPRQIGPTISEVLMLGVLDKEGHTVLLTPNKDAKLGSKVF